MKKWLRYCVWIIFLGQPLGSMAQSSIVIKGKVVNSESGEPVPFAHIGLCDEPKGTVANDLGEFHFNLPPYKLYDTICITAVGFDTERFQINHTTTMRDFEIAPSTKVLTGVVIGDEKITARRVLKKAANKILKNYPKNEFQLSGYYRDYLKRNDEYISLLEGAFTVQDPGFNKPDSKTKVRIDQLRFTDSYLKYFEKYMSGYQEDSTKVFIHGITPFFEGNEFSNMRFHNPIRNYGEGVPFIGGFVNLHESNYSFEIEYYTYLDGEEVYVISMQPNKDFHYPHVDVEGEIYVRTKDYAVVKLNYQYFVTKKLVKKKWYELNLEYKEYNERMYLKYLSYVNYYKIFVDYDISEIYQFREFFVNEVRTEGFEDIRQGNTIDERRPLHMQDIETDEDFWENYNLTLLEQPLKD